MQTIRCLADRYVSAGLVTRRGDELVVGRDVSAAKAEQLLRDFPLWFEVIADDAAAASAGDDEGAAASGDQSQTADAAGAPRRAASRRSSAGG